MWGVVGCGPMAGAGGRSQLRLPGGQKLRGQQGLDLWVFQEPLTICGAPEEAHTFQDRV